MSLLYDKAVTNILAEKFLSESISESGSAVECENHNIALRSLLHSRHTVLEPRESCKNVASAHYRCLHLRLQISMILV